MDLVWVRDGIASRHPIPKHPQSNTMIPPTDKPKQMYILTMYDGVAWKSVRVYSNKIKSDRRRLLYTYGTYDKTKYYLMSTRLEPEIDTRSD